MAEKEPGDTPSFAGEGGKRRAQSVADNATQAKKPHVAVDASEVGAAGAADAAGAAACAPIAVRYAPGGCGRRSVRKSKSNARMGLIFANLPAAVAS
jgi:hypothetical protein